MSDQTQDPASERRARVLIVEPERAYLGILARRVAELGYRVATADSIHQAIAEFYRRSPDLILIELKARNFHCADFIGIVRSDPVHRDIPILVIAGRSDRDSAAAAFRSGADGVITKPFHFEVLAARFERELERKNSIDELRATNRALDARIIERAIAIGELKDRIAQLAAERLSLSRSL